MFNYISQDIIGHLYNQGGYNVHTFWSGLKVMKYITIDYLMLNH